MSHSPLPRRCRVPGCTFSQCLAGSPHYCRICKTVDVDHFSRDCPLREVVRQQGGIVDKKGAGVVGRTCGDACGAHSQTGQLNAGPVTSAVLLHHPQFDQHHQTQVEPPPTPPPVPSTSTKRPRDEAIATPVQPTKRGGGASNSQRSSAYTRSPTGQLGAGLVGGSAVLPGEPLCQPVSFSPVLNNTPVLSPVSTSSRGVGDGVWVATSRLEKEFAVLKMAQLLRREPNECQMLLASNQWRFHKVFSSEFSSELEGVGQPLGVVPPRMWTLELEPCNWQFVDMPKALEESQDWEVLSSDGASHTGAKKCNCQKGLVLKLTPEGVSSWKYEDFTEVPFFVTSGSARTDCAFRVYSRNIVAVKLHMGPLTYEFNVSALINVTAAPAAGVSSV